MTQFQLVSSFQPTGDQPTAIRRFGKLFLNDQFDFGARIKRVICVDL